MPQLKISIPANISLAQLPMSMLYLARKHPQIGVDDLKIACIDAARRLPEHQRGQGTIVTPPDLKLGEINFFVGLISACYPQLGPDHLEMVRKDLALTLVSYTFRGKTRNEIVESLWPVVNGQAGQFDPEMLTALREKIDGQAEFAQDDISFPLDLSIDSLQDFINFYTTLFPDTPIDFLNAQSNKFLECTAKSDKLVQGIEEANYATRDVIVTKVWVTIKQNPAYFNDQIILRAARRLPPYPINYSTPILPSTMAPEDFPGYMELFTKFFPDTPSGYFDHLRKSADNLFTVAQRSILIDCESESDTLLLVFSGLNGRHLHGFEFMTYFGKYDANKIFVKDPLAAWYQFGLPGISTDVRGALEHLRGLIAQHPGKKITSVGVSAGGYMAILAGIILDLDAVIAFAPQTFLGDDLRAQIGEDRWQEENSRINNAPGLNRDYFDLRPLLESAERIPPIDVHYSMECLLDEKHANHLAGLENITIHCHEGDVHNVAWALREKGELDQALGLYNFQDLDRSEGYYTNESNWQ